jgi:hypothetical protein
VCEGGTYQENRGSSFVCKLCAAGQSRHREAATSCSRANTPDLAPRSAQTVRLSDFISAPIPTRSECIRCPVGKYVDGTGADGCIECSAGRYCIRQQRWLAKVCRVQHWQSKPQRCIPCEEYSAGTLCPEGNLVLARPCLGGQVMLLWYHPNRCEELIALPGRAHRHEYEFCQHVSRDSITSTTDLCLMMYAINANRTVLHLR